MSRVWAELVQSVGVFKFSDFLPNFISRHHSTHIFNFHRRKFSKNKMAPIRSKKISSKPTQMQAPEKIFISKLKGNDQIITPLSQLKEMASEKNSYHTVKGEIESVKHIIYKACVKCGRSVKDGNQCGLCGILCVPKIKLFFKLSIADDSGSVHNVSCFDDKIAKFLGIKIGTKEEEIGEVLQKIMAIGSILVRLSVKKEVYDEKEYINCIISDISK